MMWIHSVQSRGGGTTLALSDQLWIAPRICHETRVRLTFVLLKLVKVGRVNLQCLSPPPVDLSRNRSPKDLIKHGIRHVIVRSAALVLGNGEGVLVESVTVSSRHTDAGACWITHRIRSCPGPRHGERPEVRDPQRLGDVYTAHGGRRLDQEVRALACFPGGFQEVVEPASELNIRIELALL